MDKNEKELVLFVVVIVASIGIALMTFNYFQESFKPNVCHAVVGGMCSLEDRTCSEEAVVEVCN